ncbi:MAG TPA: TlpA disulfide reductase family protein [Usitatibacter sp.]|nr:TlpA disulfide reductase family protein [Usitatibacter sp.]
MFAAAAVALADEDPIRPWGDRPTPVLTTKSLEGKSVDLRDLQGRVVLVNFWATWCGPCKEELPALAKLPKAFAGKPFELVTVNDGESPETISRYLKRAKLDIPVWLGPENTAASGWRVQGLPMTFLVDSKGHVRYWVYGERNWGEGESFKLIESLLAEAGHA